MAIAPPLAPGDLPASVLSLCDADDFEDDDEFQDWPQYLQSLAPSCIHTLVVPFPRDSPNPKGWVLAGLRRRDIGPDSQYLFPQDRGGLQLEAVLLGARGFEGQAADQGHMLLTAPMLEHMSYNTRHAGVPIANHEWIFNDRKSALCTLADLLAPGSPFEDTGRRTQAQGMWGTLPILRYTPDRRRPAAGVTGPSGGAGDRPGQCRATVRLCAQCCRGPAQAGVSGPFATAAKLQVCVGCRAAYYCGAECQQRAWKAHKVPCKPFAQRGLVACVEMTDAAHMQHVFLPPDNPAFDAGAPSPIMGLCGIPLVLQQLAPGRNNEWCTWLMADPVSGFAPFEWLDVGLVRVCRRDRMPITRDHMVQLGSFMADLMDRFGDEDPSKIQTRCMTKAYFVKFLTRIVETRNLNPDQGDQFGDPLGVSW